jgi:putative heme iron utilization protein
MVQVNTSSEPTPTRGDLAADARALIRRGLKASLATIAADSAHPYASLITVATDAAGHPIFLISTLAQHTRNLAKDTRASILFDGTGAAGDPLQGARVTVLGRAEKTADASVRRRFLARHPEAPFYADFPDFSFWRLQVEGAHFIGGFGRIIDFPPTELLTSTEGADALLGAEADILEHMNEDHSDAIGLYATRLAGGPEGAWRMSGIDPDGCDLLREGDARRVVFESTVATPEEARRELVRLAAEARKQGCARKKA